MKMNYRNLDARIASLLGLEVLGEAPCFTSFTGETWFISYTGTKIYSMQPVYLRCCVCKITSLRKNEIKHVGHCARCLKIVPFYHKDDTLAREALEQICDERKIEAMSTFKASSGWLVELLDEDEWLIFGAQDKSLPLAICKALGELEIE